MTVGNFYRMDGWVKTTQGPAVPGAQIYVCNQPANVFPPTTPARTTPVPWTGPTPLAQIWSDDGFTPIVQPILTDGFGHYDFYALPGLYTIVVVFNGTVQQYYVDQSVGNVGTSLGSSVLFSTNGSPNFNQLVQNLVQGGGIEIVTDNFGNTVISSSGGGGLVLETNGTLNGDQALQNLVDGSNVSIVQDGAGNVTIGCVDVTSTPEASRWVIWESSNGATWLVVGDAEDTADSGASQAANAANATAGLSTTIEVSNQFRTYSGQPFIFPNRNISFEGTVQLRYDVIGAASNFITGVSNASGVTYPLSSNDIMAFYVQKLTNDPFGEIQFVCGTGGSFSYLNTGVTVVPNFRYKVSFTFNAGVVTTYVNGANTGTLSSGIPVNPMQVYWGLFGAGFSGSTFATFEYMYASNATP